jgi:type I restriction enzyme S subunit
MPMPPIEEQRRIADILDRADALRAKRVQSLALLDGLPQSIFLDMFGDPNPRTTRWPVVKLGSMLESAQYGTSTKADIIGEFPVLRMGNVTSDGRVDLRDLKYMDLSPVGQRKYLVKRGDILFNRTNSADLVGKTAIVRETRPLAFAGYLVRLRVLPEHDPEYLAAFLNSRYSKRLLRMMCKSIIGMANINAREVQSILVGVPPRRLQQQFAKRVASTEAARATYMRGSEQLDELFTSLQQRAFAGEL